MPTNPLCDCFDVPLGLLEQSHSELGQIRGIYVMAEFWCHSTTPFVDTAYALTYDPDAETWSTTISILVALVIGGPTVAVEAEMVATGREPTNLVVTLRRSPGAGGAMLAKWENDQLWDAHRSVEMHLIDHDPTATALRWQPRVCLKPFGVIESDCAGVSPFKQYGIWHLPTLYVMVPKVSDTPVTVGSISGIDVFLEWTGNPAGPQPCILHGEKTIRVFMEATVTTDAGHDLTITVTQLNIAGSSLGSYTVTAYMLFTWGDDPGMTSLSPYGMPVITTDPVGLSDADLGWHDVGGIMVPLWTDLTLDIEYSYADAPLEYVCHSPRTDTDTTDPCGGTCTWKVSRDCHDLDAGTYVYGWDIVEDGCGGKCDPGKKCEAHPPYVIDPTPLTDVEAAAYPDHDLIAELGVPQEGSCGCGSAYTPAPCVCRGSSLWRVDRKACTSGYVYKYVLQSSTCEGDCCAPKVPSSPTLGFSSTLREDLEPLVGQVFAGDCECGATYTPEECETCETCDDLGDTMTFTIAGASPSYLNGVYVLTRNVGDCSWSGVNTTWNGTDPRVYADLSYDDGSSTWILVAHIPDFPSFTNTWLSAEQSVCDTIVVYQQEIEFGSGWPDPIEVDNS